MHTGNSPSSPDTAEDDYLFAPPQEQEGETMFQYPGTQAPGSAFGSECPLPLLYQVVGEQRPEHRDTAVALFSGNGVHGVRDRCSTRQPQHKFPCITLGLQPDLKCLSAFHSTTDNFLIIHIASAASKANFSTCCHDFFKQPTSS
jgi:hypothetical protein